MKSFEAWLRSKNLDPHTVIYYVFVITWTYMHMLVWGGWFWLQILCVYQMTSSNYSIYGLYSSTMVPLALLETLQWLEMLHSGFRYGILATKKCRHITICFLELDRNSVIQFFHLAMKYNLVMFCLLHARGYLDPRRSDRNITEEAYISDSLQMGYVWVLFAWSLWETVKFPFYWFKLMFVKFRVLYWLKYNLFFVLFPIAFAAQMRCWYGLIQLLNENVSDPKANYEMFAGITIRGWAMGSLVLTPIVGSAVFYGMFVQRSNYLNAPTEKELQTKSD